MTDSGLLLPGAQKTSENCTPGTNTGDSGLKQELVIVDDGLPGEVGENGGIRMDGSEKACG
jgi:hypothetical protein